MNSSKIAIPYAKALFGIALEENVLEETLHDMDLILEISRSNRDFRLMLKSPVIITEKKIHIIQALFGNRMSKLCLSYILIILRKKREPILNDIAFEFRELYKDYKGILTTFLKTSEPVSEDVRKKIVEVLKAQTQKEIELVEETDAGLIGGFILRWKDQQYDASVLHQINKLKKEVEGINLYVKGF
jgi:F-type H+-transporting ATPase subunit delta